MKVLIAHNSNEIAASLLPMIQVIPAVEVLSPTLNARATLESARAHDPEVLIISARIPGAKETDLLQIIREENPGATLIILTQLTFPEFRRRLEVWKDLISVDDSGLHLPLARLTGVGTQNGGVWVKFSCGEFGFLRLPDEVIFDVVAMTL